MRVGLLLFFCLVWTPIHSIEHPLSREACVHQLTEASWYVRFVRDLNFVPDTNYVLAQTNGYEEFKAFFEKSEKFSGDETLAILKRHHEIILSTQYEITHGSTSNLYYHQKNKGKFRTEPGPVEFLDFNDWEEAKKWPIPFLQKTEGKKGKHEVYEWRTLIFGIPEEFLPMNQVRIGEYDPLFFRKEEGFQFAHVHPNFEGSFIYPVLLPIRSPEWQSKLDVALQCGQRSIFCPTPNEEFYEKKNKAYADKMAKILTDIRSKSENSASNFREKLENISDYYHAAINCQFFAGVNNSLLMSQVNYLLTEVCDLNPIPHARLDYLAYALPWWRFREVFLESVFKFNEDCRVNLPSALGTAPDATKFSRIFDGARA